MSENKKKFVLVGDGGYEKVMFPGLSAIIMLLMLVPLCCASDERLLQKHFSSGVFLFIFKEGEDTVAHMYLIDSSANLACSRSTSQMSTLMANTSSWRCGIPALRKSTIVPEPSAMPT